MKSTGQHMRVAIASCAQFVGNTPEDLQVIGVLQDLGVPTVHAAWDDAGVDWSSFDLVVIRSTWDYPGRRDAFLQWASRLPRVLNAYEILRWNTDKHYLSDFAKADVPVIPTIFLEPGDPFELPAEPFVVKPAVSCGAKDTARYEPAHNVAARAHVERLHAASRTAMIQPYFDEIEQSGEVSLIYIGGVYSHAICRGALLSGADSPEVRSWDPNNTRVYEPTIVERLLAERVMSAIPGGAGNILYARIDMIPGAAGEPTLLELELTEPSLFLDYTPGGPERLARAIIAAWQSHESFRSSKWDSKLGTHSNGTASPDGNGSRHHDG
jgi:hypothetical protein